jgi:hypothetical protein
MAQKNKVSVSGTSIKANRYAKDYTSGTIFRASDESLWMVVRAYSGLNQSAGLVNLAEGYLSPENPFIYGTVLAPNATVTVEVQ